MGRDDRIKKELSVEKKEKKMKFNKRWLEKRWVAYSVATCSAVALFMILMNLPQFFVWLGVLVKYLSPVILGIIIAYVMNPIMIFFERSVVYKIKSKKLKRSLAIALSMVVVIAIMTLLLVAIVPQLIGNAVAFFNNFDGYARSLQKFLDSITKRAAEINVDMSNFNNITDTIINYLTSSVPKNINTIISTSVGIGRRIIDTLISFVLAIYLLSGKERILAGTKRLMTAFLSAKTYVETMTFWKRCNKILTRYIVGEIVDAFIVGFANFLFMTVAGMNYKLLVSVVVGVTNLAPTFGPIVGGFLGAILLLFVNPTDALLFVIFTVILQTFDGYIIKPKLFGSSLGVSSLWILVSIIVFSRMFGIIGILLSIPLAAICDFMYNDAIKRRIEKKHEKVKEETGRKDEDI